MITIIVSLIYTGIKIGYPLSNGEIFRLWFITTVPIIQFLILQCLNIIWTCVLSRTIKKNKKKSLLKRIFMGSRNNCSANNGIGDICDHVK